MEKTNCIITPKDYSSRLYSLCNEVYEDTLTLLVKYCPNALTSKGEYLPDSGVFRSYDDMPEAIGAVRINDSNKIEYLFECDADNGNYEWMDDLEEYNPTDVIDLYYAVLAHINTMPNLIEAKNKTPKFKTDHII